MTPRSARAVQAAIRDSDLIPRGKFDSAMAHPKLHAWKVLHASSAYEPVRALLEAQSSSGMLPELLMPPPGLPGLGEGSLWRRWSNVRTWRRALQESSAASCEVVHAHCFSAGMAAVRMFPAVVYELEQFLEDQGGYPARSRHRRGPRILKAAEWFVLSRAAAIVVRNQSTRQELLRRAVAAEHVFVIPRCLPMPDVEGMRVLPFRRHESRDDPFTIFSSLNVGAGWQGWLGELLTAAQSARRRVPTLTLQLEIDEGLRQETSRLLSQLETKKLEVRLLDEAAAAQAMSGCSIVVAGAARQAGAASVENTLATAALYEAKPLLAADLACNRDVSPDGSGCIWFTPGNAADMARRIVFLASDAAFRNALGAGGSRYLRETRSPARIAEQYDVVYWHAIVRRRSGRWQTPSVSWQPSQALI